MEFNYNVKATRVQPEGAVGFLFEPQTIKIIVGDKNEAGDMVSIQTVMRQEIDGGYNEQARVQLLPVSVLAAINGFDVTSMLPTINPAQLNTILAGFNLATV